MIDGLAVVDKPAGMTSHDVVMACRRQFGQRRVGHAGTLDPDATGVLLVGLGRATRLMQFLAGLGKSYTCEIVLGVATDTLDASGKVTATWDMSAVTVGQAREVARRLTGVIEQVPPMVSAVKVGGRRLHELARSGLEVERAPRTVTVTRFELAALGSRSSDTLSGPLLAAEVDCSSGTYVRALASELGALLGGGAHLRHLRRTAVGPWRAEAAVRLESLGPESVVSASEALGHLARVVVEGGLELAVRHGRVLERPLLGPDLAGEGPWAVVDGGGQLLAVYRQHGAHSVKPAVVLGPKSAE